MNAKPRRPERSKALFFNKALNYQEITALAREQVVVMAGLVFATPPMDRGKAEEGADGVVTLWRAMTFALKEKGDPAAANNRLSDMRDFDTLFTLTVQQLSHEVGQSDKGD